MTAHASLNGLRLHGQHGHLSALEQCKVWALRGVWKGEGKGAYGICNFIAKKVLKNGGRHPSTEATAQLLNQIGGNSEWHPGEHCGDRRGRKQAWATSRSVMASKASAREVTCTAVCTSGKHAVLNLLPAMPSTRKLCTIV